VPVPAIWLGRVVNHRLHGERFLRYVYVGLAGIGVVLLAQSVRWQGERITLWFELVFC
jgi:hypothetical protein